MKYKKIIGLSLVLIIMCLAFVGSASAFSGGSGTSADPYLISTPEDLQEIATQPAAFFKQVNSIDLSGINWTPIDCEFTGNYEGDWNTISYLTCDKGGLFKCVKGGSFYRLYINSCSISSANSTDNGIGFIANKFVGNGGNSYFQSIFVNDCFINDGKSGVNAGALIGTIEDTSSSHMYLSYCDINNCYIVGNTMDATAIGGIIGKITGTPEVVFSYCTVNYCDIQTRFSHAGGFIGEANGNINISDAQVISCIIKTFGNDTNLGFGGIIGKMPNGNTAEFTTVKVFNSFIDGNSSKAGGICGLECEAIIGNSITVQNCNINGSYAGGILPYGSDSAYVPQINNTTVKGCEITASNTATGLIHIATGGSFVDFSTDTVVNCNVYGALNSFNTCNKTGTQCTESGVTNNAGEYLMINTTGIVAQFDSSTNKEYIKFQDGGATGFRGSVVNSKDYGYGTFAGGSFSMTNGINTYSGYMIPNQNQEFEIDWSLIGDTGTFNTTTDLGNPKQTQTYTFEFSKIDPLAIHAFGFLVFEGSVGEEFSSSSLVNGGVEPYTYKYYQSTDGGTTWTEKTTGLSGADNNKKFTFDAVGNYTIKFTVTDSSTPTPSTADSWESGMTSYVTINITNKPLITSITCEPQRGPSGVSLKLNVVATSPLGNPLNYEWKNQEATVIGNTAEVYTVYTGVGSYRMYTYQVKVSDSVTGEYNTQSFNFIEYPYYHITGDKTTAPLNVPTTVTFTVDDGGYYNKKYQTSTDSTHWTDLSGASDTFTDTTPTTHYYRSLLEIPTGFSGEFDYCATDVVTCASSGGLPVITNEKVSPNKITTQQDVNLSADVDTQGMTTTYQWSIMIPNTAVYTDITGATTKDYTYSFAYADYGDYYFKLTATNGAGSAVSTAVKLTYSSSVTPEETASKYAQLAMLIAILAPLAMAGILVLNIVRNGPSTALVVGTICSIGAVIVIAIVFIVIFGTFDASVFGFK